MANEGRETLLVILGAGASYDCLPGPGIDGPDTEIPVPGMDDGTRRPYNDLVPPLTYQLGRTGWLQNQLLEYYPQATPVVAELRTRLGQGDSSLTLEQALKDYEMKAATDPQRWRQLAMFRFYLRHLLWVCTDAMQSPLLSGGDTNQLRLLHRLREWAFEADGRVLVVCFNYDLLVERACERIWNFHDNYSNREVDRFALVKPHGSIDWVRKLVNPVGIPDSGIVEAAAVSHFATTEPLPELPDDHVKAPWRLHLGRPFHGWPVLALPVVGKTDLLWPADQDPAFDECKGTVTRVLSIGWRAQEAHFTPLLADLGKATQTEILTVDPGSHSDRHVAERTAVTLENAFRRPQRLVRSKWRQMAFRSFIESPGYLDEFLSS